MEVKRLPSVSVIQHMCCPKLPRPVISSMSSSITSSSIQITVTDTNMECGAETLFLLRSLLDTALLIPVISYIAT